MVEAHCATMLKHGLIVYSPIVHCHELALRHDMPHAFEFWQHYNQGMLDVATELVILQLDGWQESVGLKGEAEYAAAIQLPISFQEFKWPR
jgi:hypothetical protein